ncbi:DEAD/DEAH box helicase [Corynebacterium lizhenjunii]|uniref:DEAD/DEAH box helicase n=1 Tax=Corynebacterium lizhenjunii TaxID=2709394 RepID=UPI0013EE2265|nr:DEAD/DEAH box helicase [Corynebacterium lizhenjunii]
MTQNNQQPTFAALGVAAEIVDALRERDIVHTFSIQELTLPIALAGHDLIGQARTGMGKTYGFGVPLLDRIFDDANVAELDGTPRALVVVPTRELAVQVSKDLDLAARYLPVRVATLCGGHDMAQQISQLHKGVDVVVGTPGRLIDLHRQRELNLDNIAVLVLDEADEMLDLGFLPDIEKLLKAIEASPHQTMLFSATMPGPIVALARNFMDKPVHVRAEEVDAAPTHEAIKKVTFQAHRLDKEAILSRALQAPNRGKTIIFARTKRSAAMLAQDLAQRGFRVGAVHGDLDQADREKSLDAFRSGVVDLLVATDVAARGIDIDDVTHVFNYQVPDDPQTFIHRIGRTGRAGHSGTAVTLVGYDELPKWQIINDEHGLELPVPPQWFSTSPELAAALDFPADAPETVGPPTAAIGAKPARGSGSRSRGGQAQHSVPRRPAPRRAGTRSGSNSRGRRR